MKNSGALKISTPTERELVMTRAFEAPRALVFEALTRPERLRRWFDGPPGWSLAVCEIDLRVGGSYRYVWLGSEGAEMGMGGIYREIVVPERVVATEKFDDPWYPGEALVTMALTEEAGRTTLTQTVLYESREALEGVLKSPMEGGVAYTYDRLEEFLATLVEERVGA
jgi:uncharacterized protein YndB with AHSA1/START domain